MSFFYFVVKLIRSEVLNFYLFLFYMESKATQPLFFSKFVDPLSIIKQLDIALGSAIADFGCGAGFFSIPLAQQVGKEGRVYSFDILPQALESVESKAKLLGISNIRVKRVNLENEKSSGLKNEEADWVVLKDVLFQNKKKVNILEEAHRILKPGGKILVLEWNDENFSVGPNKKLRISSDKMLELVKKCKFKIEKNIIAGNFHYSFVAVKG